MCAIHSKPVEKLNETNYFFKLSEFQDKLLAHYEANPTFIQPDSARNEVVSFVRSGLSDLSISRSKERFDWGIDIPWDDSHITYVWFDALLNYVTAAGWADDPEKFASLWPADIQVVGKDILRFHAVIWPAMLMAAGLQPPRQVFGHGWLLVGGEKMSKSKLTGIAPNQITDQFGSDAFRYYFMKAIGFGSDGSFSWEDLNARYHAELANGFGNLASRTIAMVNRYFEGIVPAASELAAADEQVMSVAKTAVSGAEVAIDKVQIHDAIAKAWTLVDELNNYITVQEPWVLAKDEANRDRLATVLNTALQGIASLSVLFAPIMPKSTSKLFAAICPGVDLASVKIQQAADWKLISTGTKLGDLEVLFPRVEE